MCAQELLHLMQTGKHTYLVKACRCVSEVRAQAITSLVDVLAACVSLLLLQHSYVVCFHFAWFACTLWTACGQIEVWTVLMIFKGYDLLP